MKKNKLISLFILSYSILIMSCYSVFSGGTGGLVVDSESTATPKSGIANVDVYAYISSGERDSDFDKWQEGTKFVPAAEYYGHTTTGTDGSFTIGKLVWKEAKPDFGKDADYTNVYLLFYHENYGLTKGQTVIISDSSTDTVYAELTPIRKSTTVNLNFIDVASGSNTNHAVYVKISVPQATAMNPEAGAKVYDDIITGTGSILVSYPRWTSQENKAAGIENTPDVTITYVQSSDEITWKGCFNADNEQKNYAFRSDAETGIVRTIKNPVYGVTFYGKSTRLNVPSINGQYTNTGTSSDDGILISMKQKDGTGNYTIDLGQVTTASQTVGTSSTEKHGMFAGLGNGYTWNDTAYTGKYSVLDVEITSTGVANKMQLRSDVANYNVQLKAEIKPEEPVSEK